MFKFRSTQKELMDDLELNDSALIANLDEIEWTNRWFGSYRCVISALNKIYQQNKPSFDNSELKIADLGCGSGDLLRVIAHWANQRQVKIKLIGIDANACILNYAAEKSSHVSNITFSQCNILSDEFKAMQFEIVMLNSFCHHFDNESLISFLVQLQNQCNLAIIINDLHRHWLPYWSIKLISKLLKFSYLAQHDGPLSVRKAFKRADLQRLLQSIPFDSKKLTSRNLIKWRWAFRWQVIMWCNR